MAQITQKRQTPETGIVLGSGKLEEASLAAQTLGAECAVFDGELTGSQIRNISNALGGLEVIDRTMLILEIFRSRAETLVQKLLADAPESELVIQSLLPVTAPRRSPGTA